MSFLLDISPSDLGFQAPFVDYLPIQNQTIDFVAEAFGEGVGYVGICCPTGSGKSLAAVSIAKALGLRTAVLTSFKGLENQYADNFAPYGMADIRGRNNYDCAHYSHLDCRGGASLGCPYTKGKGCSYEIEKSVAKVANLVVTNYAYWMSVSDKANGIERSEKEADELGANPFELLVMDECFIAGTRVGSTPIEDIKVGDLVPSWDRVLGDVQREVVNVFIKPTSKLIRLTLENGFSFISTLNHPTGILNHNGKYDFIPASHLKIGDYVLCSRHHENKENLSNTELPLVSDSVSNNSSAKRRNEKSGSSVLHKGMWETISQPGSSAKSEIAQREISKFTKNEKTQSNEVCFNTSESINYAENSRLETYSAGRQRPRIDSASDAIGIHVGMEDGSNHIDRRQTQNIDATSLQFGYSRRESADCNRSGRFIAWCIESTKSRQEENAVPAISRVASIEILESGSNGEFERLCPDGIVYNLEVKETHTYIANGIIVHNCHEAPKLLADYVSCKLFERDAKKLGDYPRGENLDEWNAWAKHVEPTLKDEIKFAEMELILLGKKATPAQVNNLHSLQGLAQTVNKIAWANGSDWIVELELGTKYGRLWKFDCIWPGKYAKQYLFCGVPRVLVMSATLKEKTMWDLGIAKSEYSFKAWPRIFPGNRHPIYKVHAKKSNGKNISLNHKSTDQEIEQLVHWIDNQIIQPRLDRKGMICTMSYNWQKKIFEYSQYATVMIGNTGDPNSDTAQEVAEEFRKSKPPTLLVSPSFGTGWDFKYEQCEYLIVFKTPWIPAFSKISQARLKQDPSYTDYQGIQMLEQMVGRPMRAPDDRAEIFLVDGSIEGFLYRNKNLAQQWFYPAVRGVSTVPKPPMRLVDEQRLIGGTR